MFYGIVIVAILMLLIAAYLVSEPPHQRVLSACCSGAMHGMLMGLATGGLTGSLRMAVILACVSPVVGMARCHIFPDPG